MIETRMIKQFAVAALAVAGAQQVFAGAIQNDAGDDVEEIEEVVVYGEKTLGLLRRELYRAEENFFATFNGLIDDPDFKVNCFYEAPTGTRIKRHVCRANFVSDATSADALQWFSDKPQTPAPPAGSVVAQKSKQLEQMMVELISVRPELLNALLNYAEAREELELQRKERCAGKTFVCD